MVAIINYKYQSSKGPGIESRYRLDDVLHFVAFSLTGLTKSMTGYRMAAIINYNYQSSKGPGIESRYRLDVVVIFLAFYRWNTIIINININNR